MNSKLFSVLSILAILLPPGLLAQEKGKDPDKNKEAIYGSVDFGVRYSEGEVYGRLLEKLEMHSNAELMRYAIENSLMDS